MTNARAGATSAVLKDGKVLVVGGFGLSQPDRARPGDELLAEAEIFDPQTGGSTPTGSLPTGRGGLHSLSLQDGRVVVFGGTISARLRPS
jgi:N-acetylneuraminic acid mutarotase